jgi:NhaP-type Na+/H+ or K+/H+ antiporter
MTEHAVFILASIGIIALACQAIAWWLKLPAILFLLLAGIVAGPVTGWLNPAALFGDLLFPFLTLSVAVILFEGSLTLKIGEIRGTETVVRRLITGGVLITWIITALATRWWMGFSWELSFLFGAIMVVTGPTVVVPMLRTVRPNAHIANILRWEGIIIDPVGALLAVLVYEFILSSQGDFALGHTVVTFVKVVFTGTLLGVAGGYSLGVVLRRHLLPEYLHNTATLTLVFALFALANSLAGESGLLTVTIMGLWLANMRNVDVDHILDFKETLSLLLISALFIILAARVEFSQFTQLGWPALAVFAIIQFVARPMKMAYATWNSSLTWRERALLGWIAPRGIVAAAVSALFALRLETQQFAQASLLVPMTLLVIIGTVVLQSATARLFAKALGVAEPEPRGFLIIGANSVARALGEALQSHGFHALLSDTSWDNVSSARMAGLKAFYGNPVSEYADRHLDLVGIGRLLALSPRDDVNRLASLRYQPEFGGNAVYSLAPPASKGTSAMRQLAIKRSGQVLFSEDATYAKLASLIRQGAEIHSTQLSEKFGYQELLATYGADSLPLFALTPNERLRVFKVDAGIKPGPGWTIISLIKKQAETKENGQQPAGARNGGGKSNDGGKS